MKRVEKGDIRMGNVRMKINDITWKISSESLYPKKTDIIRLKFEK